MCFTRKFRITEAEPPPDVKEAFTNYSAGGSHMTADQLHHFLQAVQGDSAATLPDAQRIVDQILQRRHHIVKFTRNGLALEDFYYFLFSTDLNPPIRPQVHQDMNAPLSHYFIYTGHNSYLTGNQLSSDCSDVPIINALKRGVRVIELDLWPNSSKNNVLVLHGRTLTTPVELMKCLKSIKEHAFTASPYPVIITLEDHLTPDLQAKVAKMLTQVFGKLLFYPESECMKELPSPEELKHRIIISTKPPKEYLEAETFSGNKSQKEKDSDEDVWGKEPLKPADKDKISVVNGQSGESKDANEDDSEQILQTLEPPVYKRIIAIHAGKPTGTLKEALDIDVDKVRRLSLSEQALEKAAEANGLDAVRFTHKNILRIYPKGTRFNSSNYKPLLAWTYGAQMVAFNMQGYGRSLWLMHGMFRSNGGCGFVKKPDFLTQIGPSGEVFNPKTKLQVKKTLKVKVYMGDGWHLDFKQTHFDRYSPPDFYCKVGIAGVADDVMMKKTKKKEDMWTPVWNEEFEFPLTVPELALLRIEVHEYDMSEKDDFGGQTCLPVSELRQGIHAVPLFDQKGDKYDNARLLMCFQFA